MILKSADDKSKRLQLLEDLQQSPLLNDFQRKWLREQLPRERKGIQGEKDSAYYLDQYFKHGENHVVIHDLRLVVDGDVAQIDHLIINRAFGIYLIETKNYAGNLSINDHGEFTAEYDSGARFGIPSPLEQSQRHERILVKLLERLEIKNRAGGTMNFHHVVMLHPKAIITRPSPKAFDSSRVIKADQFPSWHKQFVDKELGVGATLKVMLNMRGLDTIKAWGEKLVRQHRPANPLDMPEFMQPSKPVPAIAMPTTPIQHRAPSSSLAPKTSVPAPRPASISPREHPTPPAASLPATEKKLICAQCGTKISYAEGKFCWNNSKRFGGLQYCRDHQRAF
jgi:hypothetical protein